MQPRAIRDRDLVEVRFKAGVGPLPFTSDWSTQEPTSDARLLLYVRFLARRTDAPDPLRSFA